MRIVIEIEPGEIGAKAPAVTATPMLTQPSAQAAIPPTGGGAAAVPPQVRATAAAIGAVDAGPAPRSAPPAGAPAAMITGTSSAPSAPGRYDMAAGPAPTARPAVLRQPGGRAT
jgi:hypothetical protein